MIQREELLDLFRKLPKESFELILRNLQIRQKLEMLWERYNEKEISSDDFEEIFNEIFRLFFRPLESMLQIGKSIKFFFLNEKLFTRIQENLLNAYMDFIKAWIQHVRTLSRIYDDEIEEPIESFIEAWESYLEEYSEVEYSDILSYTKELPFLIPKETSEYLFRSIESWFSFEKNFQEYKDILLYIYRKAIHNFLNVINERRVESFDQFAAVFAEFVAKEFDYVLKSDEYLRIQSRMINSLMDYIYNARRYMESIFENSPLNPFATVNQLDEAYKRITDLKRKVRELEKRIEKLEGRNYA